MSQLDFLFAADGFDPQEPKHQAWPPFRGTTDQSKHASWTGSVHATDARTANILTLRQLWTVPRTMNEIAAMSGLPLSSVCSLKSAIEDELEFVDHEIMEWPQGRATKRSRWRLKR